MHRSSYLRMQYLTDYYKPYYAEGKDKIKVLDIGSFDMNGTYKELFNNWGNVEYTGCDMSAGPNVDIVLKDVYNWKDIEDNTFDLIISGQVFEHVEYPWLTMKEIERALKPSGFCIVIAPNAGVEHKAPKDCYRYFSDGLRALAEWAGLYVHHTSVAGTPEAEGMEEWVSDWNDACLVVQKPPFDSREIDDPFPYEWRVSVSGRTVKIIDRKSGVSV